MFVLTVFFRFAKPNGKKILHHSGTLKFRQPYKEWVEVDCEEYEQSFTQGGWTLEKKEIKSVEYV